MSGVIKFFLLGVSLAGLATLVCPHMWSGLRRRGTSVRPPA